MLLLFVDSTKEEFTSDMILLSWRYTW
jgi:hypothetical protein